MQQDISEHKLHLVQIASWNGAKHDMRTSMDAQLGITKQRPTAVYLFTVLHYYLTLLYGVFFLKF